MTEKLLSGPVSLFLAAEGADPARFEAVVCMPTFRRPDHVRLTLESIADQKTDRPFAMIVMENDADGMEGAHAAAPFFESGRLQGMIVVAHERGNCRAYNAGFETALRRFPAFKHLAVIDDDEVASPQWLENLCATAETFAADIVGGPQIPVFEDKNPPATSRHPVFRPHYGVTGPVPILYSSGNMLLSRKVMETMGPPHLDLRFNFLGGGDADFLSRCEQKGFKLAWCAEAPVHETVPARRLQKDWIRARSLRNGVISTIVEKRKRAGTTFGQTRTFAKSLALLAASPPRAALDGLRSGSAMVGIYHIYIGLGRVLGEFGYAREQYREPEKN